MRTTCGLFHANTAASVVLAGLIAGGVVDAFTDLFGTDPILLALTGGVIIAGLNLVGALLILVWRDPSPRSLDGALGFAAGVMLAASFTSLILPGIEQGGVLPVVVGLAIGAAVLDRADKWVPHVHVLITGQQREDEATGPDRDEPAPPADGAKARGAGALGSSADAGWTAAILFIMAITIHNMPEGLAVGVGFGSGQIEDAIALMLAIGLQNIPEGLAVSVAVRNAGVGSLRYAAFTGVRAGLVEIPLALFGAWAVGIAEPVLPYAMGFAAGGMLYVIMDEIVPETHVHGNERIATIGLIIGVALMLTLDVALGA